MPASNTVSQRPVTEQIEVLKSKIVLLEGDSKAYYETAQYAMKKNREKIQELRKDNKALHKKLSDSLSQDEHVINEAFRNNPVERAALKNKTGQDAVIVMDHKVCDTLKQLNGTKHQRVERQKRLEVLQTQYTALVKDNEDADATEKGDSEDAKVMRYLENNHDKSELKMREAKHINRIYQQIKSKLQQEALTFNNNLDSTESEIELCQRELKDLQAMQNDAMLAKETAQSELHNQEDVVYAERKKREFELQQMKREAEEKKLAHERIEKRMAQRGSMSQDIMQQTEKTGSEEHFKKITTYEEAFRKIKEATGVSDTNEVVERFASQGETTAHLMELKKEGERQKMRLTEEKAKLQQEFEDMKYSGDAKLSSGQRALEEFETHMNKEEDRSGAAGSKMERASTILVSVKAGVEHLANKLQHLKATKGHVPTLQIQATSDEYVLDQLSTCEEKLLKLMEELDGKDMADLMKKMIGDEFKSKIESKLPDFNTRIDLPHAPHKDTVYDDDEDSGEDDGDVLSRNTLKKQSEQLIESKTKRRTNRRKKRTK